METKEKESYAYGLDKPEKPSTRVKLFDANENEIDFSEVGEAEAKPFEESYFDKVGDWLGKHGPAISHLFLIIGSGAGTVRNAWHLSQLDSVDVWQLIFAVLLFCGLIVECAFAYAWMKRGSFTLAGPQLATAKKLYDRSSIVMIGDLSLSLAEIAFGVGKIAQFWVGIVQPIMAVHLVRLFYQLKGEHPEAVARQNVVTLKALMRAEWVEEEAANQRLALDESRHERFMQRAALNKRHEHGRKLVAGRWFNGQMKRAVKDAVNQKLLPDALGKLKRLPKLLKLNGRKN